MFKFYFDLVEENKKLKEKLAEKEEIKICYSDILKRFDSLDPSPMDSSARKEYTAKVAGFFQNILRDKLECMIAEQKDELSLMEQPGWKQDILRANINICSLLIDWGNSMQSEYMSTHSSKEEEDNEAEEIIKNIL